MNKEILKSVNILYVEDEKDVRNFTSKTIGSIVNSIIVAEDGKDGLEKFKANPDINLILTDINMPKMDGLEMCAEIRKIDSEVPIVITSAHSDPDFLKKSIDVKVSAYAMKPIDLYHLIESIIKAVEPIFLKKELEEINKNLENRVEEAVKQTKSILDAQENMVVLTDEENILEVNKSFLNFFQVDSIEEFIESRTSIVSQFEKTDGFFSKEIIKEDKPWTKQLFEKSEIERTVKIKNSKGEYRVFTANIDDYENKGEHYVISFTDITELKEKSNLLEYQATHDQLTGLFNRQKFKNMFVREIKRDKRYENKLSVIIFDIDNFKAFNDDFGHNIGDEVLKAVAQIVLENTREHDTSVRWGGEEFLVLLPQTMKENAEKVAEKIRAAIESFEDKKIPRKITASFGVSELENTDDESSIIKRADEALYTAKREGKNKVCVN